MAAGFKDEPPRFNPVITRSMIIDEMRSHFREDIDHSAIEVTDSLDVIQVLQGDVAPFNNGESEFYKGQSLGLVHISSGNGAKLAQLRLRGTITLWHDYDINVTKDQLDEYEDGNLLTPETAALDTTFLHMLGRTSFTRFQAEQSLEHFKRWPSVLGDVLGPRIAAIV